jgi:hypothetical protein
MLPWPENDVVSFMSGSIEIFARDVSDVEGYVYARYVTPPELEDDGPQSEPIKLTGKLVGPYCKRARTLPTEFPFRDLGPAQPGIAEVIVPDPCTWSPDLPHLYQADVEARQGDRTLAEYHGTIGLRRVAD